MADEWHDDVSAGHHSRQKNLPPQDQPYLCGLFAPGLAQNWIIFEQNGPFLCWL